MQDVQKVAVLAMIQSIEGQLLALRGLVGFDITIPNPAARAAKESENSRPAQTQYMSDEEENKLDSELELIRKDALSEADIVQRRWQAQRKAMDEALEGSPI